MSYYFISIYYLPIYLHTAVRDTVTTTYSMYDADIIRIPWCSSDKPSVQQADSWRLTDWLSASPPLSDRGMRYYQPLPSLILTHQQTHQHIDVWWQQQLRQYDVWCMMYDFISYLFSPFSPVTRTGIVLRLGNRALLRLLLLLSSWLVLLLLLLLFITSPFSTSSVLSALYTP